MPDTPDLNAAFKQATANGDPFALDLGPFCDQCKGAGEWETWPAFGGGPRTVPCWECEGTGLQPQYRTKENP